ncbi:MAG: hypothetical protein KDE19_05310, partial [Caldilineaceae bacterium]|nr:hypothetical protein [Caldilineaceae bacterium]
SDPSDLRTFTASVPLLRFSATVNGDGTVTLSWQTGPTSNIVGFNLLRSASPDADYAPVNETLITGDCAAVGGCQYQDTPPGVGPYYYKLQQIDSAGSAEDLDGGNMVIVWMNQVHQSYLPLIQR